MRPIDFEGANARLGQPADWDEATMGKCDVLPCRYEIDPDLGPQFRSRWKPTAEELVTLLGGGCVELTVTGAGHPPVMLAACAP